MLELFKGLMNPTVVAALLFVWVGTSVYRGVAEWIDKRQVTTAFVKAIIKRDRDHAAAVKAKDEFIEIVAKDRETKDAQIDEYREELEAYEREKDAKPAVAPVAACRWDADDVRMLNRGIATRRGR